MFVRHLIVLHPLIDWQLIAHWCPVQAAITGNFAFFQFFQMEAMTGNVACFNFLPLSESLLLLHNVTAICQCWNGIKSFQQFSNRQICLFRVDILDILLTKHCQKVQTWNSEKFTVWISQINFLHFKLWILLSGPGLLYWERCGYTWNVHVAK